MQSTPRWMLWASGPVVLWWALANTSRLAFIEAAIAHLPAWLTTAGGICCLTGFAAVALVYVYRLRVEGWNVWAPAIWVLVFLTTPFAFHCARAPTPAFTWIGLILVIASFVMKLAIAARE